MDEGEFDENQISKLLKVLNYSLLWMWWKKFGIDYDDLELFGKYKG